jgi:hypothetical protein
VTPLTGWDLIDVMIHLMYPIAKGHYGNTAICTVPVPKNGNIKNNRRDNNMAVMGTVPRVTVFKFYVEEHLQKHTPHILPTG